MRTPACLAFVAFIGGCHILGGHGDYSDTGAGGSPAQGGMDTSRGGSATSVAATGGGGGATGGSGGATGGSGGATGGSGGAGGVSPACTNGLRDGLETDIDCGGTLCQPCGNEKLCTVDADCLTSKCNAAMLCKPWLSVTRGSGRFLVVDSAADANGNTYVFGTIDGTVDLGLGMMPSATSLDWLLVKYAPDGDVIWFQQIGSPSAHIAIGVAVDPTNQEPVVLGTCRNGFMFPGEAALSLPSSAHLCLGRLNTSGSATVWGGAYVRSTGNGNSVAAKGAVHVTTTGATIIVGEAMATLDFGGGIEATIENVSGAREVYVAKFSPIGAATAATMIGSTATDPGHLVRYESSAFNDGQLVVGGLFNAPDVLVGTQTTPHLHHLSDPTNADAFLVRLGADLAPLTAPLVVGSVGEDRATALALATNGEAYAAYTTNALDLQVDANMTTAPGTVAADRHTVLVRYAANNDALWVATLGAVGAGVPVTRSLALNGARLLLGNSHNVSDLRYILGQSNTPVPAAQQNCRQHGIMSVDRVSGAYLGDIRFGGPHPVNKYYVNPIVNVAPSTGAITLAGSFENTAVADCRMSAGGIEAQPAMIEDGFLVGAGDLGL